MDEDTITTLQGALERLKSDYQKAKGGNNAARVRARRTLMDIKKIASDGRRLLSAGASENESSEEQGTADEEQKEAINAA